MTVHQRNEESRETYFPVVSPSTKNPWPTMDNGSSSWDRNSRATSSSWPGEMEEVATRKIIKLWEAIERNIYGEDDETLMEPSADECNQWKGQLIHLRIIGKSPTSQIQNETNENQRSAGRKSGTNDDRFGEEIIMEDLYQSQDISGSSRYPRLVEEQKNVFELILEYVCDELVKREEEKREEVDTLRKDLDEVLRITPAPTYSGRKWTKSRKKRDNGDNRKTSANDNQRSNLDKTVDQIDQDSGIKERTVNDEGIEKNDSDVRQVGRNKLGTVFNEKIVVSPVPFVVSTRESFTTLRTTPISFRTQHFESSISQGLGRYMNSASKTNSAQRMSSLRLPQSHSAWQAPVCPTVWPKNIRLAPIDPSRLPSSKNRSSIDSLAGLPHRNRNSLSPITRPLKTSTSANQRNNNNNNDDQGLEIQGKKIVTRSPKKISLKTSWDCSPRNVKNSRTKGRNIKKLDDNR